ncbi:hypothetical protein [Streptomyces durmitorensis]|nr:hypothetical protein [Streptomyces durmitorensis]
MEPPEATVRQTARRSRAPVQARRPRFDTDTDTDAVTDADQREGSGLA